MKEAPDVSQNITWHDTAYLEVMDMNEILLFYLGAVYFGMDYRFILNVLKASGNWLEIPWKNVYAVGTCSKLWNSLYL